jgi:bacteriorhodopsin
LVPRDLEKIIDHCLEKSPDARWQSMADLKGALQALKEALEAGKRIGSQPAIKLTWRSWLWAGAATVLLTSATAVWLFRGSTKKPTAAFEVVPLTSITLLSSS